MVTPTEFGGRFVVGEKIVERPGCTVYRGSDRELGNREVAIKVFADSPGDNREWIERFQNELALLRSASHPALVPIISGGCENGLFYLAMELINGPTLRDYMKNHGGPIEPDMATELIAELAAGLKELHEKQGYHGHIDSRAVMFKGDDARLAGYIPQIIATIQKGQTSSGKFAVDPAYIAPEQISDAGVVDHRADIYALTVLLYEMVTGQKPFTGSNPLQVAMMRLTKNPESPRKHNSALSPLLDAAIMKGLAKDSKERFASLDEFVDAITGGKKAPKNPLLAAMEEGSERLTTATIPVSMSTDALKHILQMQAASAPKIRPQSDPGVLGTATAMKAVAPEEDLNAASTVMGMKVDEKLKGSFICTAGERRGKRFSIDKPQVLIGSDPGCDIVVSGKSVPSRYAIVTNRNAAYFVGPLSPTPLVINGEEEKTAGDIGLKRGDTLRVGTEELRFIEPGEVFTLQDNVADRVIDRPKSKMPLILTGVASVVIVLCVVLFYSYRNTVAARDQQARLEAEKRKKEQTQLVDRLRKEGDELFNKGQLIEPPGENARERFEQIRAVFPEDTYAKRRLIEIEERAKVVAEQDAKRRQFAERIKQLLGDADRYIKAGAYVSPPGSNAREAYQEVLRFDPRNEDASKGLVEINRILGDFVGKIGSLVARAKVMIDLGNYISPPGENAFELAKRVLAIDPQNPEGKALIVDIAARSLIEGDTAKASVRAEEMRNAYLAAKAVGVDPEFIDDKLKGADTIRRATSDVVIIDRSSDKRSDKKVDSKFLNMSDIEDRISVLQAQGYGAAVDQSRRLVEIKKR